AEALAWFGEVQAINTRVAELESAIADEVLKEIGSEAKPDDLAVAIRTAMRASTNPEIVSLRSEIAELKASRPEKRGQFLETPSIDSHEAALAEFVRAGNIGDYGAIFTTYNQMAALDSGKPRRDKDGSKKDASAPKFAYRDTFLRRMVNQNAMLILDESHNAGAAGDGKFPKVGDVVRALVKSSGSVFYSSATFAKNPSVMDVYSKTDLGQAFTSSDDLARAIGTVPQQQVASAMLVEAGQYIRRERSFNGIEYKIDTVEADTKAPEDVSTAMRLTVEFDDAKRAALADIQNDLDAEGGVISAVTGGMSTGSVESTNFTSVMHNVINTFLLSLKADAAADAAIEAIKRGEKPVLTVANTMEMFIKDYTLAAGLAVGDPLNASFADVLMRYLEKTRYARIKHANGEEERVWLSDRQLGPDGVEAYETAKGFIEQMRLSIPLSPIDYIKEKIQAAGFSIGEITGRQMVVEGGAIRPRNKAELNTAGKKNTIAKFNGGTLDALIINRSGSTGLSMHASETFADQRRRVMIVAQAELDINNHMQMLGRINRTGQVSQAKPGARQGTYGLPRYVQLTANVPIEMRPAAVLAAKMASLSANTTAGRKSSVEDSAAPDFMNKYGDEVAALMVGGDPGLNRRLGYPIKLDEDGVPSSQNAIARVTGRIGLLPLREQQAIYDTISQEYKDLIAQLDALGKNDLEAKTYPLEAKVLATETIIEGTGSSPFTSPVVAEKVDVRRLGKPYSSEKVRQFVAEALGGKTAEQQRRETMETFRREAQAEVAAARLEAKTDADQAAIKRLEEALQTAWVRFQQVAPFIGRPVVIKTTSNGNIYGVPISFERKKGAKSVGAMSSWRVRYAVVDGARVMTFPLSQVYADNAPALSDSAVVVQEATTMNVVNADKTGFDEVPVLDAFDRGQTEGRETRTVMTGNLLRASANFPGRLISYTTADGSVRQGLMTPATFDLAAAQAKLTPEMTDPTKIVDFLSRGGIIVDRETGGEIIRIRKTYRYEISTAKAGKGRKIATDAGLYMASAGSKMRGNLSVGDEGALTTFLGNVLKNQGIPLTTSADTKDLAGTPPKFSRTGPTFPAGFVSPRLLSAEVAKITANLDTDLATVKVVNRVEDLPEAIRQAVYNVGAKNQVRGLAMPTGDVYLVAENIGSVEEGRFVLFHEVYGHVGMRAFLGDGYSMQMRTLKAANPGLAREADAWFKKYGKAETQARIDAGMTPEKAAAAVRDLAVEEALADRAGDAPAIKGWQRLMAALQRALRRMGLGSVADMLEGMTEAETLDLLVQARRTVQSGQMARGLNIGRMPAYQRVWHGTPYRGIERFSTDAIGTGEGAQAYGWGLYFASKREVADYYRRKLAGDGSRTFTKDGTTIEAAADLAEAYFQPGRIVRGYGGADKVLKFERTDDGGWMVQVVGVKANGEPLAMAQRARWHSTFPDAPTLKAVLEDDGWTASTPGQLYEVEIPEDSEMLLWDKPLSEQPAKVRQIIGARTVRE
ncbi:MAG: mismatch repair protein MutS, partial [Pseudomonadota bacterium]